MIAPRVLLTRRLPTLAADLLARAGFQVDVATNDLPMPRDELLGRANGCSAVLSAFGDAIDDAFLAAAGPQLRIVANFAVGYDNIDVAAARRRGIHVTNTPGVLTDATADLAWALILATARHLGAGERLVRSGAWSGWTPTQLLGLELHAATLGVVGAGRIGSAVARRAAGFGMEIIYTLPRDNGELDKSVGARRVELDELLARAVVVTLHVPMRPENRHLIGRPQLARMRPDAILVNTARGPIVDEAALLDALRAGTIAGAGLDVYEFEPRVTPGLAELENVVLLPHMGSGTHATRDAMARIAAANIIAVLAGDAPLNPV